MARPFDKEQSPLSPMSATSSSTPISYKANVNRNKTKKWADAKPVSYGGDDWGDDDDYDLPPPPVSKPTGFRQQGQGVGGQKPEPPVVGNKKNYGDLPAVPPPAGSIRPRVNSFDADDEKRNFSSGIVRKPSPAQAPKAPQPPVIPPESAPATRFSQITGIPSVRDPSGPPALSISTQLPAPPAVTGLRKVSAVSPSSGSPHPDVLLPGRVISNDSSSMVSPVSNLSDARTPSIDYQARRDYSPSAVPPPLHTRGSPAPQSAIDSPSARFPARKSSLSQSTGPDLSEITRTPQEQPSSKPWASAAPPASPGATPKSPSTQGKALPFIRPADIYKRAEEEREKGRQSMDSSRPSMDSIGGKASDRSDSPAARQHLKEKSSSDSLNAGGKRGTSFDGDDSLDSGRLRSTLEPVKERKSEYGFEGYNATKHIPRVEASENDGLRDRDALDVVEERSHSTSPKLPDLNRISGFGMDIFTKPKPEVQATEDKEATPTNSSKSHPPPEADPSLRNQPSLGFNSVVNQAFDRGDDSSVPDTPASRSNSQMTRTNSESTGTTGISPIMSRVPSTANPESRNRDVPAPSTLEVVNETSGSPARENSDPQQPEEISAPLPPAFKPGHRRDISTPSPGNSPARTPDLAKPPNFPSGQEAIISDPSSGSTEDEEDDLPLQPPRPITGREHSFRPSLPGGWTSFATTAESETPQEEERRGTEVLNRAQTPPTGSSSVSGRDDDSALDITPTNTRHPMPQSALGAAALGVAMTGATGDDGVKDFDSPASTPHTGPRIVKEAQHLPGDNDLPTPDPSMAPSGSLYSANALDSRVLPKLETASQKPQMRPDTFNRTISADSSEAPLPPPKDESESEDDDGWDESPKAVDSLKAKPFDDVAYDKRLETPSGPQILSTISTDTRPQEEESDKLSKEIMQSLSPKPSEAAKNDESFLSDQLDDQSSSNPARISSYLPSEYDNYWATSTEDEPPAPVVSSPAPHETETPMRIQPPATIIVSSPSHTESKKAPEQPLSSPDTERTLGASRPSMPQRFSWEASSEDVRALPKDNKRGIVPDGSEHNANRRDSEDDSEDETQQELEPKPNVSETVRAPPPNPLGSHPADQDEHHGRDAALIAGGAAALGGVAAATYSSHQQPQSERRLSLAEEKDPRVSSYPVSPTPPEDQHPSRLSETHLSPNLDHPSDPSAASGPSIHSAASVHSAVAPSSVSPVNSPLQPLQPQFSPTSRILAFKEIAGFQSPYQRIQKFDETRHRFANMDSGLNNWMSALQAQHAEHSDVTASFGGSRTTFPNGSARGKFAKGPGGAAPPLQQPYYQQYLNASSPTAPGTPVSRTGPSVTSGSQQGFSPAPNKISTQQVQAKGKELLHTAGIFGGKAGKAGKGLIAKGKNKLRGAGGGEKTSSSPPPSKPKNERRTSWGLPLTLSRSGGHGDGSSRTSRESTPGPMPSQPQFQPRQRSATLTLDTSHPPVQSSMTAATDDSFAIMSAPGILDNLGMSGALPARETHAAQEPEPNGSRDIQDHSKRDDESESQSKLGVPAPIGKNQPSWDPFNATPIAEEEGYHFEGGPRHQSRPMQPAPSNSLPVPPQSMQKPNSERSDSGETEFHDAREAPEAPSDLSDWVMVAKDVQPPVVSKPAQIASKPAPATSQALDLPIMQRSILERPRGSVDDVSSADVNSANVNSAHANSLDVTNRSRGDSSTSILNRPRYSYDVPPPAKATPAPMQATTPPMQPTPQSQIRGSSQGPRYSYDVPRPVEAISPPPQPRSIPSESRPPPVNTNFIQNARAQQLEQEPATATSFKGLPPIRRTSTFGIGFGSRQNKKRFPIDDEDESNHRSGQHPDDDIPPVPQTQYPSQQSRIPAPEPPFPERPSMTRNRLSDQSQRTVGPATQSQPLYNAPRAGDFPPVVDGFRRSQDAWRPNVAAAPQSQPPPQASNVPPPRQSQEQQRSRAPSFSQQPDVIYNERMGKTVLNQQVNPFDTEPPSAARRYPSLFRPGQPDFEGPRDGGDLPAHYYQAPIPREAAFLPRQQTNEYQLPGVGPPADEPRPASRRNSGLFKEIGNRIRSASRERSNSMSHENGPQSPGRFDAQGNEYAESSVTSEETQDQKKLRGGFFGINRASTMGMGPPQSRESMVAHNPGSRTDLLNSTQPSPITSTHDRKRSFFGSNNNSPDPKAKGNKLLRASTSSMNDEPGKKKRFSGLTTMFGRASKDRDAPSSRGSTSERPQAARELSHHERQPIESPAPDQTRFISQQNQLNLPNPKPPSQQRSFLTKITTGPGETSHSHQDGKSRQKSLSSSGLLSGIMGRRSNQQDKREDSTSQGTRSQGSQPQYRPNQVPPARTYTDLQEQPGPKQPAAAPWQARPEQVVPAPENERDRGRRQSREPRYDAVPIPGGYSLVRGEGALPVATDYDPRGFNRTQQNEPRYDQDRRGVQQNSGPPGGPARISSQQQVAPNAALGSQQSNDRRASNNRPPNLGPVETFEDYQHSSRRISREDVLARSPAREPQGQQRPYQLSLPEDSEDRDHPVTLDREIPVISPPSSIRSPSSILTSQITPIKNPQHNSIQRLGQPTLRHPQSPAGYPLPDDTVFSPVNPSANHLPPPPPPKWPQHLDNQDHHHLNLNANLDRSNTLRTAVSAISHISVQQNMLAPQGALDKETGGRDITPSPTPPSPGITPPPQRSLTPPKHSQHGRDSIQTTTLNRGQSPDLYNASPRVPKPVSDLGNNGHNIGSKQAVDAERERARQIASAQEEKIYYNKDRLGPPSDDEEPGPASMSATSYPGQEWNPYAGVYEDEY